MRSLFPLGEIVSHELAEDEDEVDEVYWNGSVSGSLKLDIIRNADERQPSQTKGWKSIWSVLVPQRIRLFLWLVVQDRLMTNANRFLQQLTDDPRCFACGEVEENTMHILRQCPAARMVWKKLEVGCTWIIVKV